MAKYKGSYLENCANEERGSTNRQRSFAGAWGDGSPTVGAARDRPSAACTPACRLPGWSGAGARSIDIAAAASHTGRRTRRRRTLRKHVKGLAGSYFKAKTDRVRRYGTEAARGTYRRSKGLRGRDRGARGAFHGARGGRPRGPPRRWPAPAPRATRRAANTPRLLPQT